MKNTIFAGDEPWKVLDIRASANCLQLISEGFLLYGKKNNDRSQFQNVQFCPRSRKAKILTTGIYGNFSRINHAVA